MSRLDKQLDRLSGEKLIRIDWPDDDSVDIGELRRRLVREIDEHTQRIPLDLREVKGAPEALVELLVDMRRYAASHSKILSTTWVLPPLRRALEDRWHRPIGSSVKPSADPEAEAAAKLADACLRGADKKTEYDLSNAERIERKRQKKASRAPAKQRWWRLLAVIVVASLAVAAIEFVVLFQQDEIVVVPEKGFEEVSRP